MLGTDVRIADSDLSVPAATRPSPLATVAHELRGPMSALETAAETLLRDFDELSDARRRQIVATIYRRTLWMRGLLDNLLCDAALRDGELRLLPRLVDIGELIEDVAAHFDAALAQRGQRLEVRGDILPLVPADPHRVSQVLMNLVANSNKYADPSSTIVIETTRHGGVVRITVLDESAGLPPATFRRLFQAYDRAGRRSGDGMGIGLWVVRSIVDAHGGHVGAANRETGGTAFWFELPLSSVDTMPAPAIPTVRRAATAT